MKQNPRPKNIPFQGEASRCPLIGKLMPGQNYTPDLSRKKSVALWVFSRWAAGKNLNGSILPVCAII
jgi:hypothetical protein